MKNSKIYCKFISQVKSSQVKSSRKIVSLIALLFILLFSISCKAKQKPEEHSRTELVGNWCGVITVYDNGFIHHNFGYSYSIGKVDENFYYPYTVTMKQKTGDDYNVIGTIIFNSATDCVVNYTKLYYYDYGWKCGDVNFYHNYKRDAEYLLPTE